MGYAPARTGPHRSEIGKSQPVRKMIASTTQASATTTKTLTSASGRGELSARGRQAPRHW